MLVPAIVAISLALVFYSLGVWSERLQRTLKAWHVVVFWLGFVFDTTGTTLMTRMAEDAARNLFHGITGYAAIVLMLVHAVWATIVIVRNSEGGKTKFHRFSIIVWVVWLVPFLSGMMLGMGNG